MPQHEDKNCPRCNQPFECKVGSILLCQCSTVKLGETERRYISELYSDCLCASCMQDLRHKYQVQQFRTKIDALLRTLRN